MSESPNKCILPDLGKLSPFSRCATKKSPVYPSRKCRRYVFARSAMNEEILELLRESFSGDDYELVLLELETLNLSHVMANSQSQLDSVLKGILKLSEGDINKISTYVAAAKKDCRDILYWSGM